jgi:sortase A
MSVEEPGAASTELKRPRRRRRKVTVVGVLGEVFLTAGVFVLLYLGWQLWLNDVIVGNEQEHQATALSQSWARAQSSATPKPTDPGEPVVTKAPANAERFGRLIIPRFGKGWTRPIAQGIGVKDVLNVSGVGHYPGTAMPGGLGNFAIASHRDAYGGGFHNLHQLRVGDHVFVETKDGWYQYTFRNLHYVQPTAVTVLQPVPEHPDTSPTQRMITMTTCNPFYSTAERIVAYGVFDTWYPRAGGPPAEIAKTVNAKD